MTDFQSIYNGNYTKLFRVAMKMVGNGDSARDIVHDVFVKFHDREIEGYLILYPSSWQSIKNGIPGWLYLWPSDSEKSIRCTFKAGKIQSK